MTKTLVLVVGMHRTGSSLITRSLPTLGIELGDNLLEAIEDVNDKGFFEDKDLLHLNIALLTSLGMDWDHLRPVTASDVEFLKAEGFLLHAAKMLRGKLGAKQAFGFKDPRSAKLLPFWKAVCTHLGYDTKYLLTIRNPVSVAHSIAKRDGMDIRKAHMLWLSHLSETMLHFENEVVAVVDYDHFLSDPETGIDYLARTFGREISAQEKTSYLDSFIDNNLRHHEYQPEDATADPACPSLSAMIYGHLRQLAINQQSLAHETHQTWINEKREQLTNSTFPYLLIDDLDNDVKSKASRTEALESALEKSQEENIALSSTTKELREEIKASENINASLSSRILALEAQLLQTTEQHQAESRNASETIDNLDILIKTKSAAEEAQHHEILSLKARVSESEERYRTIANALNSCEAMLDTIRASKSWKLTMPLRVVARTGRGTLAAPGGMTKGIKVFLRRAIHSLHYLRRGDFQGIAKRIINIRQEDRHIAAARFTAAPKEGKTWCIITPGHTLFLAHTLAQRLEHHGWNVEITTAPPEKFDHQMYIVMAAQIFDRLPPGEKRIIYQLEQSSSSRWFTKKYFELLNNSLAVLEYSATNFEFLADHNITFPHVHYLPIGATDQPAEEAEATEKEFDILFYGDCLSSSRRRELLNEASRHFNVKIVNDSFGEEIRRLIRKSKIVINLHYYENALLEMPRIQECLSLGVPVVSEDTTDQTDYPELGDAVRFFATGDKQAMIQTLAEALDDTEFKNKAIRSVEKSKNRFNFMMDRFLVAMNFLPASAVKNMSIPISKDAGFLSLSMPETFERRRVFNENKPAGIEVFDAIRRRPGWIGTGLSYQTMTRNALERGMNRLTIMEDDALLPEDFDEKFTLIQQWLTRHEGSWDVFAGVIALLHPDVNILDVQRENGITFVTIDRMVSMVFNVYSQRFMKTLQAWDPENQDAETNTIDRFIESRVNLRVITTLPFFVSHREELHSSLWGIQNSQYSELIRNAEQALEEKVNIFESKAASTSSHEVA